MNTTLLDAAGLNLQAVFNLDTLPPEIVASLGAADQGQTYRQLILLGHAGTTLWNAVKASGIVSVNPIDDFTVATFGQWASEHLATRAYRIVYPGPAAIGLQALGKLAGWHHASPFMVGINDRWGTWFAYRAVILADSDFAPTPPLPTHSPCEACRGRVCIASCPAGALDDDQFDLARCLDYRRLPSSRCRTTCVARLSCPVASAHQYSTEQIRHSYSISMRWIERGDAPA